MLPKNYIPTKPFPNFNGSGQRTVYRALERSCYFVGRTFRMRKPEQLVEI